MNLLEVPLLLPPIPILCLIVMIHRMTTMVMEKMKIMLHVKLDFNV